MPDPSEASSVDGHAFIVMPFEAEWSDETNGMIRAAAASLKPPLTVLRADDIFNPGRITDQIVDALRDARLVIADITELNPNVMWELGFADALDKPVVILRQRDSSAPFDIYERRQVLYSRPVTDDEVNALRQHLLGAIEAAPASGRSRPGEATRQAPIAQPVLTWEPSYEITSSEMPMLFAYGALRMHGTHSGAELIQGKEGSLHGFVLVRNVGNARAVVDLDESWVLGSNDEDQTALRRYVHPTADNPVVREDAIARIGFRIPAASAGWSSLSLEGFADRAQTNGRFAIDVTYSDPLQTLRQRAMFLVVSPGGRDYWQVHRVDYFVGDDATPVRSITFRSDESSEHKQD